MNPMKDAEVEAAVESPTPVVTGKVSPEEQLPPHVTVRGRETVSHLV